MRIRDHAFLNPGASCGGTITLPPSLAAWPALAFVVALKRLFDPSETAGLSASVELRLEDQRFHARVSGKRFEVARVDA